MGGGIAPVKEIVDPLFAHGFVLQGVGKPVAFVALDWCEIRNGAYELFRETIAKAIGTEAGSRHALLHCISTTRRSPTSKHNNCWRSTRRRARSATSRFSRRRSAASRTPRRNRLKDAKPVTHIGTGEAKVEKVASNRRYIDADGKVQYNRMSATRDAKIRDAEEGTIDPFLKTLSFWNGDTPLLGALGLRHASDELLRQGRRLGRLRRPGPQAPPGRHCRSVFQMYASGCSGNVTAGKYNDGDPDNRAVLAERMHAAMAAAWKATKKTPVKDVAFRSVPLSLEARSSAGFSEEELTKRLKDDPKPFGQCLAALG